MVVTSVKLATNTTAYRETYPSGLSARKITATVTTAWLPAFVRATALTAASLAAASTIWKRNQAQVSTPVKRTNAFALTAHQSRARSVLPTELKSAELAQATIG